MSTKLRNDALSLSVEQLRDLQLKRLKSTIEHTYKNSPVYRKKFDEAGVKPEDLTCLADLAKFPFTTKNDLRDNYPYGMFAVPRKDIVRLHASSGTTGKPTVVGYTKKDINTWAEIVARCLHVSGLGAEDTVQVSYGYGLFTGGLGAHYGVECLGATVIPMSGGQTERQVQLIHDLKPTALMVTPSYCINIIETLEKTYGTAKNTSVKVGIFGAEPWTDELRQEIETRFNIKALDIYGLSEVMGPGVAMQCLGEKGLTIWEDHFYPEIINPKTGEVLPDGEQGELVFTTITKEGLPMIRYRTRDLTKLLAGKSNAMRRMGKIVGRSDDMLIIRGVNVFPTQIEELILKTEGLIPAYELHVSKKGYMDDLHVRTEMKNYHEMEAKRLTKALQRSIKIMIGISVSIEILPENTIPRSEGKAKRVYDLRQY
ncbi:MAG: phenylacetate--CoA ligase PaaK [Moraxella sp.]|nr:phenylacetate--CoA ligase PaaK [Moraxella sp.]